MTGIPILRQTATYTTEHGGYVVRTFMLGPHWFYASVLTSAGQYVPGLDRLRCYGATAVAARLGALGEIEKFERSQRVCDFGDGRAA